MMNEIVKLKDKFGGPDVTELIEMMNGCSVMKLRVAKEEERFVEDKKTIEELTARLASLKERLNVEMITLESKLHDLSKQEEKLKELEAEKVRLFDENAKLEAEKNKLRNTKPNLRDERILENGKKKLNLYKQLTGIRWDYKVMDEVIKGYVCNGKDYIRAFCFDKNEDKERLSNLLWNEIYLSTGHNTLDNDDDNDDGDNNDNEAEESKENVALNK